MRVPLLTVVSVIALGVWVSAQATKPRATVTLVVSAGGLTMPPGGVVLVKAQASKPLAAVEGYAFGRPVRFWSDATRTHWIGLVGAGLTAKPGLYTLVINGAGESGSASSKLSLRVEPKRFETRRLKVDPQFVNPPATEAERIAAESKMMAAAFAQVTSERLWQGAFEMPVPGEATSSFGRLSVLNGESRGRHQGADFRAASGTPVRAPNGGRVALAADLYFSGNTIIIDHGLGMFSLLAHLSHIAIASGDRVSRGDVLGESGATGRVTGPHLHWAMRLSETTVDPLALVAAVATVDNQQ